MSPQQISAYVFLFKTVAHGHLWLEERLEKESPSQDSVMKANEEDRGCGWGLHYPASTAVSGTTFLAHGKCCDASDGSR